MTHTIIFRRTVFIIAVLLCLATSSVATRTEHLIDGWRPTNYSVSLTFNNSLSEITSATTEITIVSLKDSLSNIDLDFGELPIDSVKVDNRSAIYQHNGGILNIKLDHRAPRGTSLSVTV